MKYNIKEIERIIQDREVRFPEDEEIDRIACLNKWDKLFFQKIEKERISPNEFHTHCKIYKKFRDSDCSEESFKKYFPELKYENYICPWDYKLMKISEKKYQKMAFELQSHINLDFDMLLQVIKSLYVTFQKPTFENLTTYIGMHDKKMYAELLTYSVWIEMKNEKAS